MLAYAKRNQAYKIDVDTGNGVCGVSEVGSTYDGTRMAARAIGKCMPYYCDIIVLLLRYYCQVL